MPVTKLGIAHLPFDEKGEKIEPEQQPAVQYAKMPVSINLGVPDFEGVNGGAPIITQANWGQKTASIQRETTAGDLAQSYVVRCENCRHFELEKFQNARQADEARRRLAEFYIKSNFATSPTNAMLLAKHTGVCHLGAGVVPNGPAAVLPHHSCPLFVEKKNQALAKALHHKRDDILHAAEGRKVD